MIELLSLHLGKGPSSKYITGKPFIRRYIVTLGDCSLKNFIIKNEANRITKNGCLYIGLTSNYNQFNVYPVSKAPRIRAYDCHGSTDDDDDDDDDDDSIMRGVPNKGPDEYDRTGICS